MSHQAYRYALDLNDRQRGLLASHAGASRYAWNWGLRRVIDAMAAHRGGDIAQRLPTAMSLHRDWNVWKKSEEGITWWSEVSKCAPQEAFRHLEAAMRAFWESRAGRRGGPRVRFPRFKKKGRTRERFRLTGAIHVEAGHVRLPRLGRLRLHEEATPLLEHVQEGGGHITAASVSREADAGTCLWRWRWIGPCLPPMVTKTPWAWTWASSLWRRSPPARWWLVRERCDQDCAACADYPGITPAARRARPTVAG